MHDENKPSDMQNETSNCNNERKKENDVNTPTKSLDSISGVTNGLSKLTTDCSTENDTTKENDHIADEDDSPAVTNGIESTCRAMQHIDKPPRMQTQKSTENLNASSSTDSSSGECLDSTGVDVLEFLRMTLRNSHKDRAILLRFEHEMMEFINNKMVDYMKFSAMTSYHRMLLHRVAAYFGMDHNVDETGKCVIVNKIKATKIPEFRFAEYVSDCNLNQNNDDLRRRSILKRSHQSKSFDHGQSNRNEWKDNRQRSLEEREENYEKIRARIFNAEAKNGKLSSVAITTTTQLTNGSVTPSCTNTSPPTPRPRPTITVLPRSSSATCLTDSTSLQTSPSSLNNTQTSCEHKATCQRTPVSAYERKTAPFTATANGYDTNAAMTPPNVAAKNDGYSPREQRIPTYNDYPYNGVPPVPVEHQQFPQHYHGNPPASNAMYAPYNEYHMYPMPPPPSGVILPPSVQRPMHSNTQPPYHQTAVYQHSNGGHPSDAKQNGVYLKHHEHPTSNNSGGYKTYMHQHTNHAQQQQVYPVYTQPSNRTNNLQREVPLMYLPATNNHAPSYCVYSQFHTSPQNPQLGMQDISNGRSNSRRDY